MMGVRTMRPGAARLLGFALAFVAACYATTAGAQSIYVANQEAPLVSVIKTGTGTLQTSIATGGGPLGVAVSPDGTTVVVANSENNTITIADGPSGSIRATVQVGAEPSGVAISPDNTKAYVANGGDNTVSVIALSNGSKLATVGVGLSPFGVAALPNGSAVYVTNSFDNSVSVIATSSNTVTATVGVGSSPSGIAVLPDGSGVFVSNSADNTVSTISPQSNTVTATRAAGALPFGIAAAANGVVYAGNMRDGTVTVFPPGNGAVTTINVGGAPYGLTADTAGVNLFVTNKTAKSVTVITTATSKIATTIAVPGTPGSFGVFFGQGGPPNSVLAAAILPDSRSVTVGTPATFASTVLNASGSTVNNCKFALPTSAPSTLSLLYQTTTGTGQLTGSPNQPVSIAGNGGQSFLLAFQSSVATGPFSQPLAITCDGTPPAADVVGLDIPNLLFSATPVTDIIALAATAGNNGIVSGAVNATSAFAVATVNVGAAGALTALVDTQGLPLPLTAALCKSNPSTSACTGPLSSSVSVSFGAGETGTFAVFVTFNGAIPFAPATSRVFVRFLDTNGVSHGSTSVAARTL